MTVLRLIVLKQGDELITLPTSQPAGFRGMAFPDAPYRGLDTANKQDKDLCPWG